MCALLMLACRLDRNVVVHLHFVDMHDYLKI
jgi:hypothetical protein